ncbi:MAG: hypothetical protein E7462_01305 [Ruminococcaceae bacterium]|nr:hypothetical protein [Oscillospiraceae bacterium]
MPKPKLTMTLEEVCKLFRSYGIPMEVSRLADEIEAGIYPIGRVIRRGAQRRSFEIWRCDVEAFIQSKMPKSETA